MTKSQKASEPAGPAPAVLLVVGAQETLRDAVMAELRVELLGDGPREFNEDRFDFAAGAAAADVIASAQTLPILSPRRLVRVRGLDDRRARDFLEERLPAYLRDPVPTTCLVLDAPSVDRRLRWVKLVQSAGALRDCSGPGKPAEVRQWIEARLARAGRRAGRGAAAALYDCVGADLDRLAQEIDKLVLYTAERDEATAEDVAELVGGVRPLAAYELTEAISERRLPRALSVLSHLLDQGDAPLALLAALASHFRRLIRARELRPADAGSLQRAFSLHPFAAQKLAEQVARFDAPRLRRCLDAVHAADAALKGASPLPPRLAIERLVIAVSR